MKKSRFFNASTPKQPAIWPIRLNLMYSLRWVDNSGNKFQNTVHSDFWGIRPWDFYTPLPYSHCIEAQTVLSSTRYSSQNNVWFYTKRRDVFHKTTACFTQNDVLFFIKRYVTFFKWRVVLDEGAEITISLSENVHWRWTLYNCKNIHNHFSSRARVYARIHRSFYLFAVTSVTASTVNL